MDHCRLTDLRLAIRGTGVELPEGRELHGKVAIPRRTSKHWSNNSRGPGALGACRVEG